LYVGRKKNLAYLQRMIFVASDIKDERRATLFTYRRHMDELRDAADVVLVDIGWPYHGRLAATGAYLEVPDWVRMAVRLPETWDEVVRGFRHTTRNNDLRLIRRNGYRCEATNDDGALAEFYEDFYLPFVTRRHTGDSIASPRRHILKRGRQG